MLPERYTSKNLLRAIREPELFAQEIERVQNHLNRYLPHDIGVQGSYGTGNVGDRAIGEAIQNELTNRGWRTKLFGRETERSAANIRILGGGGVLHDWYGTDHLQQRLGFISEKGAIIGVGVPGFGTKKGREIAQNGLSDVDLITVRDEWSRERLSSVYNREIITTACPAFLHTDPEIETNGRTGVNFRPFFHLDKEVLTNYFDYSSDLDPAKAKERYLENMTLICESVTDPIFIPFHENDEQFAREHLDIDILPYKFSVERTLKRISAVEQMVAMRYHSLVFAAICDTRVLTIAYEPKVSYLADRLGINSYPPDENIPIEFEETSNCRELRQAAVKNFQLLEDHTL